MFVADAVKGTDRGRRGGRGGRWNRREEEEKAEKREERDTGESILVDRIRNSKLLKICRSNFSGSGSERDVRVSVTRASLTKSEMLFTLQVIRTGCQ